LRATPALDGPSAPGELLPAPAIAPAPGVALSSIAAAESTSAFTAPRRVMRDGLLAAMVG
jgi:hypothetical protein